MPSETINGTHTINDFGGLVIHVRLSYPLRLRVWCAVRLIAIAAWLLGGRIEVDEQ